MKRKERGKTMVHWYSFLLPAVIYALCLLTEVPTTWLWIKYVAFAFAVFLFSAWLFLVMPISQKRCRYAITCYIAAVLWMTLYVILCLDTYLFGACLPLSGMLRYAIFDFYIPGSVVFVVTGIAYAWGNPYS